MNERVGDEVHEPGHFGQRSDANTDRYQQQCDDACRQNPPIWRPESVVNLVQPVDQDSIATHREVDAGSREDARVALEPIGKTAPTIMRSAPIEPMNSVATSATGNCESERASMDNVPVDIYIAPTYINVGVTTAAIIASGRFRLGFLISSALVAMTSNPMKVT